MNRFIVIPNNNLPIPVRWEGDKNSLLLAIKFENDNCGKSIGNYMDGGYGGFKPNTLPTFGFAVSLVRNFMDGTYCEPKVITLEQWFEEEAVGYKYNSLS